MNKLIGYTYFMIQMIYCGCNNSSDSATLTIKDVTVHVPSSDQVPCDYHSFIFNVRVLNLSKKDLNISFQPYQNICEIDSNSCETWLILDSQYNSEIIGLKSKMPMSCIDNNTHLKPNEVKSIRFKLHIHLISNSVDEIIHIYSRFLESNFSLKTEIKSLGKEPVIIRKAKDFKIIKTQGLKPSW